MSAVKPCSVCELAITHPTLYRDVANMVEGGRATGGIPAALAALGGKGVTASKLSLEVHFGRRKNTPAHNVTVASGSSTAPLLRGEARMKLSADGSGEIETAETFEDVVDWDGMVALLGGDTRTTQVKMDTIRVSARTVIYVDDDGNVRERIARSYGASLIPRTQADHDNTEKVAQLFTSVREAIANRPVHPRPAIADSDKPVGTFGLFFGDMQIGKSEGNGIEGVVTRIYDALDRSIESYWQNVAMGERYDRVALAQMGDITEGVMGNYANQLFTVKLNKTEQEVLAREVMVSIIERIRAEIGLPVTVVSVNSNHGEQSRGGGNKNLTSNSDTVDRRLALDLKAQYEMLDAFMAESGIANPTPVDFIIPEGNLVVPAVFSGVNFAFAHGHGIGARQKATTIQQELLVYDKELQEMNGGYPFLPNVWVTAHYHHFMVQDCGPYTWIQTPALDGGSEWFTNMSGKYSRPGMLTISIGDHYEGGVDHIRPIWVKDTPTKKKPSARERVSTKRTSK
jgi:hypothetical protein